ncbi:MAG: hypothetical protein ACM31C_12650 [Acidobacteriota bacterium]
MAEISSVITASPTPGTTNLQVGVALLKGIDNAARNGGADFALNVSVTYLSVNNTIETVSSGRTPVKNTILVGAIDNRTVAVQLTISFAGHPAPGNQPSYTGTSQCVNRDPAGNDIELGPSEQSQL